MRSPSSRCESWPWFSINLRLLTVICPNIEAEADDKLEITTDKVVNQTREQSYNIAPLSKTRQAIINACGLASPKLQHG